MALMISSLSLFADTFAAFENNFWDFADRRCGVQQHVDSRLLIDKIMILEGVQASAFQLLLQFAAFQRCPVLLGAEGTADAGR